MCHECFLTDRREFARTLPEEVKIRYRIGRVASVYKISKDLAKDLVETKQCMACGGPNPKGISLHIDHCHETGSVRGALCFNCNGSLGLLGDSQERLLKLVAYLSKSKNGVEDIDKAIHYLQLLKEIEYPPTTEKP
jgi:hypothetical protein